MKQLAAYFLLAIGLVGCSQQRVAKPVSLNLRIKVPYHRKDDFLAHWKLLEKDFIACHKNQLLSLSPPSTAYLRNLLEKIISNNKILFKDFVANNQKVKVLILNDKRPFHFAIPGGKIFISSGLLKKYIDHEGLFASVLAMEVIKSHQQIAAKKIIVPTGSLSFEDLRPLLKINLALKAEVNKWTIYTLKKSGFDPLALLRLVQLKNKNFLDFFKGSLNSKEESKSSSLEEVQLKRFFVKYKLIINNSLWENSSPGFYHFINEIKKS